jgi:endonuclease YncB( thermonuclease family)
MRWPHVRNNLWLVGIVLTVVALWWFTERQDSAPTSQPVGGYEVISGAELVPSRDNDGDSFRLRHNGQDYHFRLYFVDAPEKRRFKLNEKRVQDQARYFDILAEQSVEIGLAARDYATDLLDRGNFKVYTRWKEVFDSGRYYAFVIFEDGQDLSEKLVTQGLARIHTEGAPHPDGRSLQDFNNSLRALERGAKTNQVGGWR